MQSSRRIAWVDYAKGIAIIGVFILHSNAPEGVIHVEIGRASCRERVCQYV